MARIKSIPGNLWELRSGGGLLMLFGLPFFLAGIFVTALMIGALPIEWENSSPPPLFLGVPFGLVVSSAGSRVPLVHIKTYSACNQSGLVFA